MLALRDDFLKTHAGNVHIGQVRAHVGVAFVGTHHKFAGFGDGKVDAREGGFARHEFFAQVLSSCLGQVLRIFVAFLGTQVLVEGFAHIFLFEVNGGQHDMARFFFAQLHDALAQVGIDHLNPMFKQVLIQVAFLGEHGFAFDHGLHPIFFQDTQHDLVVFQGIHRPMYLDAVLFSFFFKSHQVIVHIGEHVVFDLGSGFAQVFPFG